MKPWLLKFLLLSMSASALVIVVGRYVEGVASNVFGQASILDIAGSNEPTAATDLSEPTGVDENSNSETFEEATPSESSESDAAPAQAPEPQAVITSIIQPPIAQAVPAPAYISIPSNGFGSALAQGGQGGGSVSQPAATLAVPSTPAVSEPTPSSTENQIEIPVTPASSTPEISFICTPDEQPHPVISELFIDMVGADTQEFIKLYNPGDQDFLLASSSIQYLSGTASSTDKINKKNFPSASKIVAKGFYLIGAGDYAGPAADMTWSQSLSNTGAIVLLVRNIDLITGIDDPDIFDRVAYGTSTLPLSGNAPLLLPPVGEVLKL